jgi:hypothetical protein
MGVSYTVEPERKEPARRKRRKASDREPKLPNLSLAGEETQTFSFVLWAVKEIVKGLVNNSTGESLSWEIRHTGPPPK